MTTPFERTHALVLTRELLLKLSSVGATQVFSLEIIGKADALLWHYPSLADIELAHKANPELFGPISPFSRLAGGSETQHTIDEKKEQT